MSIRPIDMQILIPKTAEYSQQQQGEVNKQNMDQFTFTQHSTKEAERQHQTVVETNDTERSVDKDGQNKQEQRGGGKRRKQDEKEEKKDNKTGTGLFDVRI